MKWAPILVVLAVLTVVWGACGDLICEVPGEIGSCADCATRQRNYVCDSFSDNLTQHDPDCNVGADCYDSYHTYSGGRGDSCYPWRCEEGTGCTSGTCSADSDCQSGFCDGTCQETYPGSEASASYEVEPLSTAIYLGDPTFVSFQVNDRGGGGPANISAKGPCTLEHDDTVDLTGGYGVAVVKVSNCSFAGLGSIQLTAGRDSWDAVHFLSYPSLLYTQGEMPRGTVGFSAMSGRADNVPLEVKAWVG